MSTISRADNSKKNRTRIRLDGKFWTRLLVVFLVVSMLAGTFYYLLVFTLLGSRVEAQDTSAIDNYKVRVALVYNSSVAPDFKTIADAGYRLGYNDSANNFTEVITTPITTLHVACDRNLVLSSGRYVLASNASAATVGAYNIRVSCGSEFLSEIAEKFPQYNVFPSFYGGQYCIQIGQFTTKDAATSAFISIKSEVDAEIDRIENPETSDETTQLPESDTTGSVENETTESPETESSESAGAEAVNEEITTEIPDSPNQELELLKLISSATVPELSSSALTVINPADNKAIWEFEPHNGTAFGAAAIQSPTVSITYIKGFKGTTMYYYDGVLECDVVSTSDYYGVRVINVLPVETYVAGVVPYEISSSWPLETQKAFAIAVRSYVISSRNRHKSSLNADVCCTADCQVYRGFGSTTAKVRQAVNETKGLIAVYNGSICQTFYSSSTGGCTANCHEVWSANLPYLYAVATPWERYESYGNGSWTSSATGQQLFERLEAKGYTALTGAVTDVQIVQLGTNSTYVYSIKFTDAKGNTVTVKKINKVKSLLSPYLNSGNFVVGKAGEDVTRVNYTMLGFGGTYYAKAEGVYVQGHPYLYDVYGRQSFNVLTASGPQSFYDSNNETVITSSGKNVFNMAIALDSQYYPTIIGVNGKVLPDVLKLDRIVETETIKAQGPSGSFVFIGRGWGHGVGMSQWGAKDLADLGYDFETIFKAYFTGAKLMTFTEYLNI